MTFAIMFNSFFFFKFCVELRLKIVELRGGSKKIDFFSAGVQGFNFLTL